MYDKGLRYTDRIADRDSSAFGQVIYGDDHARLVLIDEAKGTVTREREREERRIDDYTF
jgi:hypothetical protein